MGILLAAEIAERITKMKLRDWLKKSVFDPLGMKSTALGLGQHKIPETEQCQVTGHDDWNWNSPYWRDLGAPWGGAHATAADVLRFLDSFLAPDGRVVKRETAKAMVTNQNAGLNEPWGLGFMVNGARFGKACSPDDVWPLGIDRHGLLGRSENRHTHGAAHHQARRSVSRLGAGACVRCGGGGRGMRLAAAALCHRGRRAQTSPSRSRSSN